MKDLNQAIVFGILFFMHICFIPLSDKDSTRCVFFENGESVRFKTVKTPVSLPYYSNHLVGYTFLSNYYKNVPIDERTADDNIHFRPYIQTTSGAIYYYEEIKHIGRRH